MKVNTKRNLLAASLVGLTGLVVFEYPRLISAGPEPAPAVIAPPAGSPELVTQPVIEAVFVLDTTGSMGGLIQAAKDKIWSIASTMASAQPAPEIRMGLVAYRDRGDDYVTQVVDLSKDLDAIQGQLMQYQAQGGGDGPESVNQALSDALHKISWSQTPNVYRVIFLVGDAPPHMDYQDDVPYPRTVAEAKGRGIRVNAIQCGTLSETGADWRRIAQIGNGSYFQVGQSGSAVAIATPYDEPLARLSAALDETRIYYGKKSERAAKHAKLEADKATQAAASSAARARRAEFVASKSGAASLLGDKELVDEVAKGRVNLESLPAAELPEPLAKLDAKEQKAVIAKTAERREEIKGKIKALSKQRSEYLKSRVEAAGGAKDSLDQKIYNAVREQAGGAGLRYEKDAPVY